MVVTPEQQQQTSELIRTTQEERDRLADNFARRLASLKPRTTSSVGSAYPDCGAENVRQALLWYADMLHENYPQYKNYWRDWLLCRASNELESKAGHFAKAGDILLVCPRCEINTGLSCGPHVCVSVWGLRSANVHSVLLINVELL